MKQAFSFVEIMVVLAIIALLLGIGLPYFSSQSLRAKTFNAEYHLIKLYRALELYWDTKILFFTEKINFLFKSVKIDKVIKNRSLKGIIDKSMFSGSELNEIIDCFEL